jgi:hypothetical protein
MDENSLIAFNTQQTLKVIMNPSMNMFLAGLNVQIVP